jgi:hypothetical protein
MGRQAKSKRSVFKHCSLIPSRAHLDPIGRIEFSVQAKGEGGTSLKCTGVAVPNPQIHKRLEITVADTWYVLKIARNWGLNVRDLTVPKTRGGAERRPVVWEIVVVSATILI